MEYAHHSCRHDRYDVRAAESLTQLFSLLERRRAGCRYRRDYSRIDAGPYLWYGGTIERARQLLHDAHECGRRYPNAPGGQTLASSARTDRWGRRWTVDRNGERAIRDLP